jgi:hypothetical protein
MVRLTSRRVDMTQDRVTETYRNYLLVAALHKGKFRGRAFKADEAQFDVEGSSVQDTLGLLRSRVDEVLTNLVKQRQSEPVTSPEYVAAFKIILNRLSDGQLAMLKAHVNAPRRTLTATELAAAAGYEHYAAASLHYGLVGRWLSEELLYPLPQRADGTKIYTCALADGLDEGTTESQWHWVMKPEVAAALESLGLNH